MSSSGKTSKHGDTQRGQSNVQTGLRHRARECDATLTAVCSRQRTVSLLKLLVELDLIHAVYGWR